MATTFTSFLFFLLSLLLILRNVHGVETTENHLRRQHFHVIGINSLFPATVCSTSGKGSKRPQGLEVAHIYGPCSPLDRQKATKTTTLDEILLQDQSRVRSIESKFTSKNNVEDSKAKIPATSGRPLGTGNFIVTLGFGTPKRDLPVVFDTGSDLTWIQCQPCEAGCYTQRDPIFNPSMSSSYSNIPCGSAECSQLPSATGNSVSCTSTCKYAIQYGDNSYSVGYFGRETLALTASDVFPNFKFGCGQGNKGLFGTTAGLLGLGRDKLSLVSQSAQKFGQKFSYCLPPTTSSTGYLAFGNQAGVSSSSIKFTPLLTNSRLPSFYFLSLIGITVGGQKLAISPAVFSSPGTLIDSGTVITRLPPSAYAALRSAFRQSMSKYPSAPSFSLFDTCYDLSGYNTITIPKIVLNFGGGADLDVDLSGIVIAVSASQVCLAFADNSNTGGLTIFGNKQQSTIEVVYDVQGGKIGFGARGCS